MPELVESIENINKWLKREYGQEADGSARWRVVWSEDQLEKRLMTHNDMGMQLLNPIVREVKKYQHISERYVLECQLAVTGETDLVTPISYEPMWTFEDRHGKYLPPRYDACVVIIESVNQNMQSHAFKRYTNPNDDPDYRAMKLQEMEEYLFGNETDTGDSLAYKEGVAGFHSKIDLPKEEIH